MAGSGDGLCVGEAVGGTIVSTVTNLSIVRVVGASVTGGGGGCRYERNVTTARTRRQTCWRLR
jgi:hypothetical protein